LETVADNLPAVVLFSSMSMSDQLRFNALASARPSGPDRWGSVPAGFVPIWVNLHCDGGLISGFCAALRRDFTQYVSSGFFRLLRRTAARPPAAGRFIPSVGLISLRPSGQTRMAGGGAAVEWLGPTLQASAKLGKISPASPSGVVRWRSRVQGSA
jgi:hypothetical protein